MKKQIIPSLNNYDWIELERELCERSLAEFVKLSWHVLEPVQAYVHGWHIDALAEHLEAVHKKQINRLLINIPPGAMKSMMTAVFFPAWEWGPMRQPNIRVIGASHEESLATRDNLKMRRLVESEWYQQRWSVSLTGDQNQKTYFENSNLGWRQSCPVRSMTGRRGDRVIWDDPHSVEDSHSKARLDEAKRVFRETLPTRLNNPDSSAIIIVMQRLADDDVSGEILSNDFGYEHLCLPMEYEPTRKCVTSIGFEDPRKEEGELLFPERFPKHIVDRDKKIMGSQASAGQFQQRPTPLGGNIVRGSWFTYYNQTPTIKYRMIYADTAQKTSERHDFSVFECWGLAEDGKIYLLDLIRGKWEAPDLKRKALSFWQKHKALDGNLGTLREMKVEDKASGTGLIQDLKSVDKIPVRGIQRNKDKYTRLMDVVAYIEAGYVCLPANASFVNDFVQECEMFTADNSHAHDDQVDPMIDAISDLLSKREPALIMEWA